jgi:hypothetical protein
VCVRVFVFVFVFVCVCVCVCTPSNVLASSLLRTAAEGYGGEHEGQSCASMRAVKRYLVNAPRFRVQGLDFSLEGLVGS